MTPLRRFYSTHPLDDDAVGLCTRERKRALRAAIARDVEAFLASGGIPQVIPAGFASVPDAPHLIERRQSPLPLPGSTPSNPSIIEARAKRRARRYGRLPS